MHVALYAAVSQASTLSRWQLELGNSVDMTMTACRMFTFTFRNRLTRGQSSVNLLDPTLFDH